MIEKDSVFPQKTSLIVSQLLLLMLSPTTRTNLYYCKNELCHYGLFLVTKDVKLVP